MNNGYTNQNINQFTDVNIDVGFHSELTFIKNSEAKLYRLDYN